MSKTDSVTIQMKELLDEINKEIEQAVDAALLDVPKATAQLLRSTSPKGSPHLRGYAEGWTTKKGRGEVIVYNKTNWQLTHLLEDGHVVRNKKGTYGRARAIKHIEPAEKQAAEDFYVRISRGIK